MLTPHTCRIGCLAAAALLLALTTPSRASVICAKRSGALVLRSDECAAREQRIDPTIAGFQGAQGPRGPEGPAGATGPKGSPGKDATAWWGFVNPDGTLGYGHGVIAASRVGLGTYVIGFAREVRGCAAMASLYNAAGEIFSSPGDEPASIVVNTRRSNGNSVNQGFFVALFCP